MNLFLQNFLIVLGQVGTLFLLMSVGFILAKLGKLLPTTLPHLSYILMYIVTPCIIIDSLQVGLADGILYDLGLGLLLVLICYLVCCVLTQFMFRTQTPDTRDTLRFACIFGNTGFMGFPLITAVLGRENLIYCMPAFLSFQAITWTYGAYLMGGKEQLAPKKMILNPAILGIVVGLPLFLGGVRLPNMIGSTVSYLADLNTPLAMVVIGAQMAFADLPATFRNLRLYESALFKLLITPILTALLLLPFGLSPVVYVAVVILAGVPTAGVTSMFAEQFNRDADSAAQVITLSTLLSILTLPLVAVVAERIVGM